MTLPHLLLRMIEARSKSMNQMAKDLPANANKRMKSALLNVAHRKVCLAEDARLLGIDVTVTDISTYIKGSKSILSHWCLVYYMS
jgi:hypothetical protein